MFQARADAAAEVEYAPRAAFRDTGPQEVVHEVKSILAAANALTPNRSMNDALRAALSVGEKARRILVVVARHVRAFESHEAGITTSRRKGAPQGEPKRRQQPPVKRPLPTQRARSHSAQARIGRADA